jgi:hypothetical protein
MRRLFPVIFAAVACTRPVVAQQQYPAMSPLAPLAFMSGCWRGVPQPNRPVIEEQYTAATTNIMLGTTRYIRDGRTVDFEFSRIQADSTGIVLVPHPRGKESVRFRLLRTSTGEVTFENPEHDFPNRIIYRRSSQDTLTARIEGNNGRAMQWQMARVACGSD